MIILVSLFSYSYFFDKDNNTKPLSNNKKEIVEERKEDKYTDNNKIILGLYKNYRNGTPRKLITEFERTWSYHNDISSFEVYYTNDYELKNDTQINLFNLYKNDYENVDNYKIGYIIDFSINDMHINKTILSPKDTTDFFDYLEVYLYDDYHRTGGWYSHTTEEEYNENTLLTSIKLTAGKSVDAIISDIKLSAFTYDSDDFYDDGSYRGKSIYTITIKKA